MIVALIPAGLVSWNPAKVQTRHRFSFQVRAELIRSTLNPVLGKIVPLQQADTASLTFITVTVFFPYSVSFFLSRRGYWEQEDQVMGNYIISFTD